MKNIRKVVATEDWEVMRGKPFIRENVLPCEKTEATQVYPFAKNCIAKMYAFCCNFYFKNGKSNLKNQESVGEMGGGIADMR